MRIVIDATSLLLRSAGVKTYTYHLVRSLRQLAGEDSVVTFPVNLHPNRLYHEGSMASPWATFAGLLRLHLTNFLGPSFLRPLPAGVRVFHASQQLRYTPRDVAVTATLHDLTCWLMPEAHTRANVLAAKRFAAVWRRAQGLIAVSESTRHDAERILGLSASKITVIHEGVAEEFFDVPPAAVQRIRERYALHRPYVLFVGTIEPRKNVAALLDAWLGLRPDYRERFELILAGPPGWNQQAVLERLRAGVPAVRYLGYVSEADLPALTAGATLFVYPSLYEGFGLPVAQAMAAGVPVLTSAVSSLPEVAGDGGLLVDPRSVEEIRAGLERLLDSESLRQSLAAKAVQRARHFRWEHCAQQSWRFFERVAGS